MLRDGRHGRVTTMSASGSVEDPARDPRAQPATRSGYDARYASLAASPLVAQLFHDGLGPDLPTEIQPFSYVPLAGLHAISEALTLQPGQHLVDLGCGAGGPGLFLAATNNARLTGVDSSVLALDHARDRIHQFLPVSHATFRLGELTASGLPDRCANGLVCIDAFHLSDPQHTAREIARLLIPGARAAITCWESTAVTRYPASIVELCTASGLNVLTSTEQHDWLDRQLQIYAAAQHVATITDDAAVTALAHEGRIFTERAPQLRRVLVIAAKPALPD